jgi:hypothetical protein
MLSNIATVLAGLIGAGVIFMGTHPFWAPQAAAGFAIPDTPTGDRTFHAWRPSRCRLGREIPALPVVMRFHFRPFPLTCLTRWESLAGRQRV